MHKCIYVGRWYVFWTNGKGDWECEAEGLDCGLVGWWGRAHWGADIWVQMKEMRSGPCKHVEGEGIVWAKAKAAVFMPCTFRGRPAGGCDGAEEEEERWGQQVRQGMGEGKSPRSHGTSKLLLRLSFLYHYTEKKNRFMVVHMEK